MKVALKIEMILLLWLHVVTPCCYSALYLLPPLWVYCVGSSIEIQPRHVYWSESGNLVCLATDDAYFVLKYNAAVVTRARDTNSNITEDGIEDAFEVRHTILYVNLVYQSFLKSPISFTAYEWPRPDLFYQWSYGFLFLDSVTYYASCILFLESDKNRKLTFFHLLYVYLVLVEIQSFECEILHFVMRSKIRSRYSQSHIKLETRRLIWPVWR